MILFTQPVKNLIQQNAVGSYLILISQKLLSLNLLKYIKEQIILNQNGTIIDNLDKLVPQSVIKELCTISNINPSSTFKNINGNSKNTFIKLLAWTPFTITGHEGFDKAMITRGGISLKEINPTSMQSKLISRLYFAGEIIDLDGPCGGYNLQWSFSSGYLAGQLQ